MTANNMPKNRWPAQCYTDGTAQSPQRYAPLQPGYFQVDELTLEQQLSFIAALSQQIRFISNSDEMARCASEAAGNNAAQRNWQPLFQHSELVTLAQIAALDLAALQRNWQALAAQPRRRQL
ncbi:MAG: hypothetical protein KJ998_08905, partial [Gammaproteobacteria bacterium]|nr:hypothetical protein [Gammaproteobacteria bacterium]